MIRSNLACRQGRLYTEFRRLTCVDSLGVHSGFAVAWRSLQYVTAELLERQRRRDLPLPIIQVKGIDEQPRGWN